MEIPVLKLTDGTEVVLPRPTMSMWRLVAEYDEVDKSEWGIVKLMNSHTEKLVQMFGLKNDDQIDPADVLPKYVETATYVIGIVNEKLKKLPNVEAEGAPE